MTRRLYRIPAMAALLVAAIPTTLLAQGASGGDGGLTLPGASGAPGGQTCVQVEVGGQKSSAYNCLNQELQQQAESDGTPAVNPPLSAASSSNQVGTFNEQGVAEQFGPNFGKSAIPYRPPAPVYGNPLSIAH